MWELRCECFHFSWGNCFIGGYINVLQKTMLKCSPQWPWHLHPHYPYSKNGSFYGPHSSSVFGCTRPMKYVLNFPNEQYCWASFPEQFFTCVPSSFNSVLLKCSGLYFHYWALRASVCFTCKYFRKYTLLQTLSSSLLFPISSRCLL